ncbi:hypothetical protein B0T10DRAFT_28055 [Thelonectria olida]|uniref:Uncharacterized protein n=1 Tax=Thelonectria olida TaxID=1576542 RepID=A0A9P8WJE1_9HYPO|nr:hypothetical protein B0T10DRAFT_28055 [Thelonectria olida]
MQENSFSYCMYAFFSGSTTATSCPQCHTIPQPVFFFLCYSFFFVVCILDSFLFSLVQTWVVFHSHSLPLLVLHSASFLLASLLLLLLLHLVSLVVRWQTCLPRFLLFLFFSFLSFSSLIRCPCVSSPGSVSACSLPSSVLVPSTCRSHTRIRAPVPRRGFPSSDISHFSRPRRDPATLFFFPVAVDRGVVVQHVER